MLQVSPPETPATLKPAVRHLTLKGVTREFQLADGPKFPALLPVDLDVAQGEFVSIIGPSGCGKSTLLDIIAGLTAPTAGEIFFEDKSLKAGAVPEGVGMVLQEDASFPWLSVYDNVAFGVRRAGLGRKEIRQRVSETLELMGLTSFAKAYPAQLSGGMRARVCIARTLVSRPRLLLLDEPFGALDAQTRLVMGDHLLTLWRETGATVILVTHALDEATMLSDRIVVLSARPGRILDVIKTGWRASRTSAIAEQARFGEITARLWSHLRVESQKTVAGDTTKTSNGVTA